MINMINNRSADGSMFDDAPEPTLEERVEELEKTIAKQQKMIDSLWSTLERGFMPA